MSLKGKIKWYNSKKGYGFIECEDKDKKDVFLHVSDLEKSFNIFNLKTRDQLLNMTKSVDSHLACVTNKSKLLIFETNDLPILKKGGGVQLQKIKKEDILSDIQTFNLNNGISWKIGSQLRNEKDISFWFGKRSQVGKKVPRRFNKDLKFYKEQS